MAKASAAALVDNAADALAEARRSLEHADRIRNADHWQGDRNGPAVASLLVALVQVGIAVADELGALRETIDSRPT